MGRYIKIRKFDHDAYLVLRARAKDEGLSFNAYLKKELHRIATMPTFPAYDATTADRSTTLST